MLILTLGSRSPLRCHSRAGSTSWRTAGRGRPLRWRSDSRRCGGQWRRTRRRRGGRGGAEKGKSSAVLVDGVLAVLETISQDLLRISVDGAVCLLIHCHYYGFVAPRLRTRTVCLSQNWVMDKGQSCWATLEECCNLISHLDYSCFAVTSNAVPQCSLLCIWFLWDILILHP